MKVKALSRSTSDYLPQGGAPSRLPRNLNPALHPFEKAREYTRALNATKIERMFAQPFICQLGNGHIDGVYCLAKDHTTLNRIASGSGDGELKIWDLAGREEALTVKDAHDGMIADLCFTATTFGSNALGRDQRLLSCAKDRLVKLWNPSINQDDNTPVATYMGHEAFNSVTHHRTEHTFATASSKIDIWDISRTNSPISSLSFGNATDSISCVRFNMTETSILASAGSDRSLIFYDLRMNSPLTKLTTAMMTNSISWNPMESFNFAAANEDHNIYIFDMRKLTRALNVLKDHVAAVMDVDYSPTGEEIVTASYDRTLRIYKPKESGHSRDIYHTKRMQRVFSTKFAMDAKYIVSGSDDGNVRLWRANASERSRVMTAREREKREYDGALKERYKHMPELRKIARHRHIPKVIKKMSETKKTEIASRKRKEENIRKHNKKSSTRRIPEREKMIVGQEK